MGEVGLSSRSSARSRSARGATTRSRTEQRTCERDPTGTRRTEASGSVSDAARRGVVEHRAHEVADREDADDPAAVDHREWRKPPWIMSTAACSVVSSGSIVSGCGVMKSPTVGALDLPAGDCAEHVALGEHALEPARRRARARRPRSARPSPSRGLYDRCRRR